MNEGAKERTRGRTPCEHCGERFLSGASPDFNEPVPENGVPWLCGNCWSKEMKRCQALGQSILHTGERPDLCEWCGFDRSQVKRAGERPDAIPEGIDLMICECGARWFGGNTKYCPSGHAYRFQTERYVRAPEEER